MLDIQTFDARRGGNVLYKALAHPLAAEALARLGAELAAAGPLAVFDPDGVAGALYALNPGLPAPAAYYVQDVERLGGSLAGRGAQPVTELGREGAASVLVAAFDAKRSVDRLATMTGGRCVSLDLARLPETMLTNRRVYLDRLNFATNFAFFRDENGLSTRLVSANYWAGYGAGEVRLWLRLYDAGGQAIATWEEALPNGPGGIAIDSSEVRERFGLPAFTGQLFVHAIGVAGHDVVKYALDTYGRGGTDRTLSVTHDANAWPSDRYAGLPAPDEGEAVTLWIQNSHAAEIPANAMALDRMGAEQPVTIDRAVGPFASVALDVAKVLPGLRWPGQIELRSGRHVVRPRYEIVKHGRRRVAHLNVERADLTPDPAIAGLSNLLGRGYLLPFPVLDPKIYRTVVQPNPMSERLRTLPLRIDAFDVEGRLAKQHFLGCLPRDHDVGFDLDSLDLPEGHAELVYDFRDGGEADGWMHAIFRYENRASGHAAETSFGAHIFNTAMTWRDEPQSYSGPPPGLSTRLFLKLGDETRRSFAVLLYPASAPWRERSATTLLLHDGAGTLLEERPLAIACSGSATVRPWAVFGEAAMRRAGERGYVLVRDATCRLFGYHGLEDGDGGFSLDHMFGF